MSYRPQNFGYYENNPRLGYSSVSKNNVNIQQQSQRNYAVNEDHNYGEIEFMLENQRKKFKEAKQKFEYDLDSQRKTRIEFENKLIKLKDQFSKREITMSQLQFKLNNLLHQNQDVIIQNQRLRNELGRLEQVYGNKIHQLETQLNMETRNFQEITIQYNNQFQKFKKQGQDYVEQLTFQFERKIKNLQEKLKATDNAKKDLALQNKKLNDILISNKLAFEEELRDIKNKAREEEIKKSQILIKNHEQKVKVLEQGKQIIIRKNQELLRVLQDKERQIQQLQNEQNEELGKYRQDNADMQQQINQLNYLVGKLKNEISEKDSFLGRSTNENGNENNSLRQQLQIKKQENADLNSRVRELRQTLKETETQWERKKRQMSDRCNMFENEARKYKEQYLRICDILKTKINETINHVSHKK